MRKLFLVLAVSALATGALASTAAANHSWGKYHWATTTAPFTVDVGDNVSSAWDTYLTGALNDWSADTAGNPLNTRKVTGGTTGATCAATLGRVEACNADYGANGWLGVAQIWLTRGSHIAQAVTKLNDYYYATNATYAAKYNTPTWRAAVTCQEIGHDWGLDHQDESGADFHTCMDYASNPDADNTHPNLHDYQQLAKIYSHRDRFTSIGRSTASSPGLSGQRGAKPESIERIDRISSSTITEHFVDGSSRLTHVRWVLG